MQKQILLALFALSLSSLTSCAQNVPDVFLCAEINMGKGYCTRTVSNQEVTIDDEHPFSFGDSAPQTWFDMRGQFILMPQESWVEIKKFIIMTCKKHKCNQDVSSWTRKVDELSVK